MIWGCHIFWKHPLDDKFTLDHIEQSIIFHIFCLYICIYISYFEISLMLYKGADKEYVGSCNTHLKTESCKLVLFLLLQVKMEILRIRNITWQKKTDHHDGLEGPQFLRFTVIRWWICQDVWFDGNGSCNFCFALAVVVFNVLILMWPLPSSRVS